MIDRLVLSIKATELRNRLRLVCTTCLLAVTGRSLENQEIQALIGRLCNKQNWIGLFHVSWRKAKGNTVTLREARTGKEIIAPGMGLTRPDVSKAGQPC